MQKKPRKKNPPVYPGTGSHVSGHEHTMREIASLPALKGCEPVLRPEVERSFSSIHVATGKQQIFK